MSASAIAALLATIIGAEPRVIDKGAFLEIELDETSKNKLRAMVGRMLDAKPGEVRFDVLGVIGPEIAKRFWWTAIIPGVLGYFVGQLGKRR